MCRLANARPSRRGAVAPLTALLLVALIAVAAFAIDLGYIAMARTQLQCAADASALAAASEMLTNLDANQQTASRASAADFAAEHRAGGAAVVVSPSADVEYGRWDPVARAFLPPDPQHATVKVNAVRVWARRDSTSQSGALGLFFARVLGLQSAAVQTEAIAYVPNPVPTTVSSGMGTRFLIDDEMFDTDEPAIEQLAALLGQTPEFLLTAKNETSPIVTDWFLNLPPETVLELPTGQVGDEGLLDIDANKGNVSLPQYPFTDQESHFKFLKYNETSANDPVSQMRNGILPKSSLDPLPGVGRFNQPSRYPELVNLDFVHVSPVWKSDVSALDGVQQADANSGPDLNDDGQPDGHTTNQAVQNGVNSLGYRRGLIAFRIIGYNLDPARPYPYLPNLIIQIVDPATIDLGAVPPGGGTVVHKAGSVHNVRLVQ